MPRRSVTWCRAGLRPDISLSFQSPVCGVKVIVVGRKGGSVVQQHDQDDQRDGYSQQPQKNRHGSLLSLFGVGLELTAQRSVAPGSIAQAAAFGSRQRGREGADE